MKCDPIKANILSIRQIPKAEPSLIKALEVPKGYSSLGIVTADIDDISYVALDEATKKADVKVVYAKSFYGGSSNASTRLAGEFIGILAGTNPEEVKSGMEAVKNFIEKIGRFYSADDNDSVVYFAHCVSRTGSYLSKISGIDEGQPIAYLIAPPAEAICALDEALKAADVKMKIFYGPPTETNFAGGILTGEQAACEAACEAFAETVIRVAAYPMQY